MGDAIARVRYSHDGMIDLIIQNPGISQGTLAGIFGYSQGWVSQVINSDAFRERLAERKEEVVDPVLKMSLEERIRGVVDRSMEVLMEKMENAPTGNLAIRVFEHGTRALGYGAQKEQKVLVNTYVAVVPVKSLSAEAWIEAHAPQLEARDSPNRLKDIEVIDMSHTLDKVANGEPG